MCLTSKTLPEPYCDFLFNDVLTQPVVNEVGERVGENSSAIWLHSIGSYYLPLATANGDVGGPVRAKYLCPLSLNSMQTLRTFIALWTQSCRHTRDPQFSPMLELKRQPRRRNVYRIARQNADVPLIYKPSGSATGI
ncbi:MAG: hypothetical protein AB8B96_21845 [Lysobacterales bacterium]